MDRFKNLVEDTVNPLREYTWYIRVSLVLFLILVVVLQNRSSNNAGKDETNFLKHLNLQVTFVIKKVKLTGNHGYGVVYGDVLKTNQLAPYTARYQNEYTICKMQGKHVLLVAYNSMMEEGDTIALNTRVSECILRRHNVPTEVNPYNIPTDFFLYAEIERNRYMEFKSY